MKHDAAKMAIAAPRRLGARYNRNSKAIGTKMMRENWHPTAIAKDSPSSRMRRQFHSTTSRGAYKVCATAIAVKTAPKAPHAAATSGGANQPELARRIAGEKQ